MTWFDWLLLGWVLVSLPVALVTGRVLRELQELQQRRGVLPQRKDGDASRRPTHAAA